MIGINYSSLLTCMLMAATSKSVMANTIVVDDSHLTPIYAIEDKDALKRKYQAKDSLNLNKMLLALNKKNNETAFSLGKVSEHQVAISKRLRPFFIFGQEESSIKWVMDNQQRLLAMHAIGFVVGTGSVEEIRSLQDETNLPIIPANIEGLPKLLSVNHYPFLVYHGWVVQ